MKEIDGMLDELLEILGEESDLVHELTDQYNEIAIDIRRLKRKTKEALENNKP